MNRLVAWFAANPVAANLVMGFAVIGGIAAVLQIAVKPYPDIDVPSVVVSMDYPGAAPEEVEAGVCRRIENAVMGIAGIETVRSAATEGTCAVRMDLFFDADAARVTDEIESRVRAINTFPLEAERLLVRKVTATDVVAEVVVTGPLEERALKELGRRVRDDLLGDRVISQAGLANARPYEIAIEVSEASLQRNGMTFDEVAQALRDRSVDLAGGSIRGGQGDVLLRTRGQLYWGEAFAELAIRVRPDGTRVLLKDVARVVDGFADTGQSVRFDGRPAALLQIGRGGEPDARRIVDSVRAFVAAAPSRYPEGVEVTLWTDESSRVADRLGALLDAGAQGLVLVLILLVAFLRPHVALWVSVGIPVALLGGVFLAYLLGLSLNAVSVVGFIVALGMIVDDAVVVGERIHHAHRSGEGPLAGAVAGARQVLVPVTFGVLTTITAFVPLLFAVGVVGEMLSVVGIVVICCLVFSLIECYCVLPAHLAHRRPRAVDSGIVFVGLLSALALAFMPDLRSAFAVAVGSASLLWAARLAGWHVRTEAAFDRVQSRFETWLDAVVENRFRRLTEIMLRNRLVTAALAFAAFATATATVAGGHLPFTLLLESEGDRVVVQLAMPPGVDPRATRAVLRDIETKAARLQGELEVEHGRPVIQHILEATGGHPSTGDSLTAVGERSGAHLGEVVIQLQPGEDRPLDAHALAELLRVRVDAPPQGAHIDFVTDRAGADPDIDVRLSGHSMQDLRASAAALRRALTAYPGVYQVGDTLTAGKEELELSVTPAGEALGITLLEAGRQLRQGFYGEEVQRVQRGEDDIRVMLRYTEAERHSLDSLDEMRIRTPDGNEVPLPSITELRARQGLSVINRTDGFRSANVTARVDARRASPNAVMRDLEAGFLPGIVERYPSVTYSLDSLREQEEVGASILPPLFLALFAVYAMLSLPLKSYAQPLIVLLAVPFVWVGAVWGHALLKLTGQVAGLSLPSIFGMVAASGVAVNASLVLLHAVNRRRADGASLENALAAAAVSRFRPILITTVTTFAGLAPLMFSRSAAAQSLVPLAVSLAFGVLVSAAAALLLIPALWLVLAKLRRRRR